MLAIGRGVDKADGHTAAASLQDRGTGRRLSQWGTGRKAKAEEEHREPEGHPTRVAEASEAPVRHEENQSGLSQACASPEPVPTGTDGDNPTGEAEANVINDSEDNDASSSSARYSSASSEADSDANDDTDTSRAAAEEEEQTRIRQGLADLDYTSAQAREAEQATRTRRRGNVHDQMISCVEWLALRQKDGDTTGGSEEHYQLPNAVNLEGSSRNAEEWKTDLSLPSANTVMVAAVNNSGKSKTVTEHLDANTSLGIAATAISELVGQSTNPSGSWTDIDDALQLEVTKWKATQNQPRPQLVSSWPTESRQNHHANSGASILVNGRFRVGATAEADPQGRWIHLQLFPSDGSSAISVVHVYGYPDTDVHKNRALMRAAWESATRGTRGEQQNTSVAFKFKNYTKVESFRDRWNELEELALQAEKTGNHLLAAQHRTERDNATGSKWFSPAKATFVMGDFNWPEGARDAFFAENGDLIPLHPIPALKGIVTRAAGKSCIDAIYYHFAKTGPSGTAEVTLLDGGVDQQHTLNNGYMDHSDHATVIAAATMAESMYLGDREKRQALQKAMEGSISAPSVIRSAEVRPEHIVIPLSPAGQETFAQRMEEETEKAIEALRLLAEADRNGPSSPEEAENMIATATKTLLLTASDHLAPLVLLTPRTIDPASEAAARRGVDYLLRHVHYTLKKAKALLRAAETNRDSQRRDTLRKAAKKSLVESDLQRMTRTANLVLAAMHAGKKSEIRGGEALEVSKAEREGAAAMATARDGLAKAQTELLAAQEGEADASAVAVLEAAVGVRQVAVEGAEAAATARTGSAEAQTELVAARAAGAEASELEGLEAVAKANEVTGHGAKAVATEREGFAADCAAQDCHSEPEPAEDSQPPALLLWGGKTVTDTWGGQPYEIFGTWPGRPSRHSAPGGRKDWTKI